MQNHHLKTIGLIGGVSWTSTQEYYKRLNEKVALKYGGFNSAKILLYSFNFAEILAHQQSGNIDKELEMLAEQAKKLETAGADVILICSNTTNKTASDLSKMINVPLLEIIPLTAEHAIKMKYKRLGLLGTKYTMYEGFYQNIFKNYNLELISPTKPIGEKVHNIIYDELTKEIFSNDSRKTIHNIINDFKSYNVDAVILGCTELPLIVSQDEVDIPIVDSVEVHVNAAFDYICK